MQNENITLLDSHSINRKTNSLEKSKYLNLPDLQFLNWCNQQYGLNKGVYNTIDNWFYRYGIINIHSRRIHLLAFLEFAKDAGLKRNKSNFIRFGHGGLIRRLHEFTKQIIIRSEGH